VSESTFINNTARDGGGAVFLESPAQLRACLFVDNAAHGVGVGGGAVFVGFFSGDGPSISNCTFRNNTATNAGGAVCLFSSAQLDGNTFENNGAQGHPTRVGGGGAVFVGNGLSGDGPLLFNCTFTSNTALYHGGAVLSLSSVQLTSNTFVSNQAQDGGAVFFQTLRAVSPSISSCTFKFAHNMALAIGGAVWLQSSAQLHGNTFANTAQFGGGAVFVNHGIRGDRPSLFNCSFMNNTAADAGGALLLLSSVRLVDSTFVDNTAQGVASGGGAVHVEGGQTQGDGPLLFDCTFTNNMAVNAGGAVWLGSSAQLQGCTFVGNTAHSFSAGGGAVYVEGGITVGSVLLFNCNFTKNTVNNGGGAVWLGSLAMLDGNIFVANTAQGRGSGAGAVYVSTGIGGNGPSLSNCTFMNNTAFNGGGAVVLSSLAQLHGNIFVGNTAKGPTSGGGAVFTNNGADGASFCDCTFADNTALFTGGAMIISALAQLDGSTFVGNIAHGVGTGGGAVYVGSGIAGDGPSFSHCTFSNNTAIDGGGAMFMQSSAQLHGTVFVRNTAQSAHSGGGAVYVDGVIGGDGPFFSNCSFTSNTVGGVGGAVWLATSAQFEGVIFSGNVASSGQGSAAWFASSVVMHRCSFCDGTARGSVACSRSNVSVDGSFSSVVKPQEVARRRALLPRTWMLVPDPFGGPMGRKSGCGTVRYVEIKRRCFTLSGKPPTSR